MKNSKDDVVEIKIKEKGKPWEEIPVALSLTLTSNEEAIALCQNIADTIGKEVRWNWARSYQGHYQLVNSR